MMQAVFRFLVVCALAMGVQFWAAATPEVAGAEEASGSPIYIGLGPSFGIDDFSNAGGIDIDEAYGFNSWAGIRLAVYFAAELNLEYLDGFDFTSFAVDVEGQALAFTVNAKVFPLTRLVSHRIDPFMYAGIGIGWAELDAGLQGASMRRLSSPVSEGALTCT